jgi:hypothetical protein
MKVYITILDNYIRNIFTAGTNGICMSPSCWYNANAK